LKKLLIYNFEIDKLLIGLSVVEECTL